MGEKQAYTKVFNAIVQEVGNDGFHDRGAGKTHLIHSHAILKPKLHSDKKMTIVVTHTYNEKLRTNLKLDDVDDEDLELIKSFKDQFMEAMKQPSVDAEIEN